jgi:Putative adhesin
MKTLLATGILFSSFSLLAQTEKAGDFHLDKEYKMESTGVIHLSSSDAKVFITGSTRATAHVKIDRVVTTKGWVFGEEKFMVDITEQDGNLMIKEKSGSTNVGMMGYYNEEYTINIEAPAGSGLVIRGDDGDYFIKEVNGSIELDLDDADIELTGCKGNNFKVRLDDGDLRMDTGKGTLEVDADDADVIIKHAAFEKIIADIDDGEFIVETSLSENGDYYINGQDGLISMTVLGGGGKFDIHHDDARVIAEGNFDTVEKSEDRTRLTLASGNAKVSIHADDARVRLIKQ